MNKRFSREFYLLISLVIGVFALILLMFPVRSVLCKVFQSDSGIIRKYYDSINHRNYKKAYGYLVDLTFRYKTGSGERIEFDVRPDYDKFVIEHEKIQNIKVISIKREDSHTYPEVGLRCFRVDLIVKYRDVILPSGGKTVSFIYTLNAGKKPFILGIRTTP